MADERPTMYQVAVQAVEAHRASCSIPECGCATADLDTMVDALTAYWLGMEV